MFLVVFISLVVTTLFFLFSVFSFSPLELYQGYVQKIMYIHVPSIFIAYLSLFIVFLCSIAYLWKNQAQYDKIALISAELGTIFCFLSLVTGSIWGKPTWNTYWTWDARLTLTLILFLIFCGYILLRYFSGDNEKIAKISSIIAIFGFFAVPLNHLAVNWWRTLHQPSTIFSSENTISPELKNFLLLSFLYFLVVFALLFCLRYAMEKKKREFQAQMSLLREDYAP